MSILDVMREIDEKLGGDCRVSISVGGAVGSTPGEEWVKNLDGKSILQVMKDGLAQPFSVTDDEWARGSELADDIVKTIEKVGKKHG